MSNLQKTGHTGAACFRILQQLPNANLQENQFINKWTRPNEEYEGNKQGQGNQGRSWQRYHMQGLDHQGSKNYYREINSFPTHPNYPLGNRFNQNPNFSRILIKIIKVEILIKIRTLT